MDVVRHQGIDPNQNVMNDRFFSKESQVLDAVFLVAKDIGSAVSSLRYVMGAARHNDSCSSRHRFCVNDRAWWAESARDHKGRGHLTAGPSLSEEK